MNCPRCGQSATQTIDIDEGFDGKITRHVHHMCRCGWDDFPPETDSTRKALADFLGEQTPRHQSPAEIEAPRKD